MYRSILCRCFVRIPKASTVWRTCKTWLANNPYLNNESCSIVRLSLPNKMGIVEEGGKGGGRRTFGQSHLFFHFSDESGVEWKDEAAARRVLRTGRFFITIHDGAAAAAACMASVPACPGGRDKRIWQQVRFHLGRPCRQASGGESPLFWDQKRR
jgi:hypothetical protein